MFQTKHFSTTPTKSLYTVSVRSSVAVSVYRQSINYAALLSNVVGNIHLVVAFSDRELVIEIKHGRKVTQKSPGRLNLYNQSAAIHFGIISSCLCNYILHTGPSNVNGALSFNCKPSFLSPRPKYSHREKSFVCLLEASNLSLLFLLSFLPMLSL